jgi:hypothetical protein
MTTNSILIGIAVAWTVAWGIVGCIKGRGQAVATMTRRARIKTLAIRYIAIFNLIVAIRLLFYVKECADYVYGR